MYYLSWNKFLLKECNLFAFSPQDQKIFPAGKKNCIVSQRECSFSLCFHFPSRDVILTLVHDRVSFESIIVEVCVYIYIFIIIIINTNVIFYYSDLSRHEIVSYINIEFHHNLLLLLRTLTCLKKCHKFHRSSHQTLKKYKCLHEYLIVFIFNFSTVVVFRNVKVCIASIMSTILKRYHLYISFD